MDDFLTVLFGIFAFWGVLIGLFLAVLITWFVSSLLWGDFKTELLLGISIPCVLLGVYLQYITEKKYF